MTPRIGINGRFLAAQTGGVQRFARSVTERLIEMADVVLPVPRDASVPEEWGRRTEIRCGRLTGHLWEQVELPGATADCDVVFHPANTAPLTGPAAVVMLHDVFPLTHPEWYAREFVLGYRMLIPLVARRAATILTTSSHTAAEIARTLKIDAGVIRTVPQGLAPFDRPAGVDEIERVRTRYGIRAPWVLVPGAGDARKNVAFAEEVAAAYVREYDELTVVVYGSAQARVYGHHVGRLMPDTVHAGYVTDDDLRALYTGAAAVLCPAYDEGFGRVPLEALACGTPCITTDHPASAETLDGTSAHRLPLDTAAWVAALRDIVQREERVSEQEREQLRDRCSWDAAADAVLEACVGAAAARQEVA